MSASRIAAASARAASAKAVLRVSAVTSEVDSDQDSFFGTSDDDFGSGVIAPSQAAPQVATGSS